MTPLATAAAAPAAGGGMTTLLLLAVPFLVLLYLMFSQRRRARAVSEAQASLQVGDEVMAAAGIFGTVVGVDGDVVQLQVAEGVVLRVARRAVIPPGTDASGRASRPPRDEGPGETA